MPVLAVDHNAVGVAQRGIGGETLFDCAQDSPLFFLTVGVELVELRGEFAGSRRIFHAE